ncbi:DUF86 domain-containing protein [Ureibacillus acetophenoni]|uniref:Uncharacterized protein YutE (UPF0331/DUF86 family) n=1 Tax=Ureibacillus acetophenoni TaxID=614649 RepID=A0A285UGV7_9BACL|nr:DUF86 domain-containing protein [Ureibacillus acetophenoni]SOC41145.1 uncharacterized protein YutE (UPF0331/DUF86 family) [Ureibacillus acetophenoni]
MYFVDRNKITLTLNHLEEILNLFKESNDWLNNDVSKLALHRIGHNTIESLMDVGNLIIDGFIMRDPGSYEDIIDILVDEKVITPDMDQPLKEVVGLRKMLVREFISVDNELLLKVLNDNVETLKKFPGHVRNYLENELGPVSAFLPENHE